MHHRYYSSFLELPVLFSVVSGFDDRLIVTRVVVSFKIPLLELPVCLLDIVTCRLLLSPDPSTLICTLFLLLALVLFALVLITVAAGVAVLWAVGIILACIP